MTSRAVRIAAIPAWSAVLSPLPAPRHGRCLDPGEEDMAVHRFEIDLEEKPDDIADALLLAASAAFHIRFSGKAVPWEAAMQSLARKIDQHVADQHMLDQDPTHDEPDRVQ
jgi:hypothetical protein